MNFFGNKKSQVFIVGIVIIAIAALIYAYIALSHSFSPEHKDERLGTYQKAIVDAYQKAEFSLLYVDLAAKYSFDNAVKKTADNGAVYSNIEKGIKSKCGSYGYKLLNDEKNECFGNDEYSKNFGNYLIEEVNQKASKIDGMVLETDYDYVINEMHTQDTSDKNSPYDIFDLTFGAIAKYDVSINVINVARQNEKITDQTSGITGKPIVLGDLVPIPKEVACVGNCMLTQAAAEKLVDAQKIASSMNYELYVYQSYRTPDEQNNQWIKQGKNRKLVCGPDNSGSFNHCPHVNGGAVDIRFKGVTMDDKAKNDLETVMYTAGWVRYNAEWWHFEYGTNRWTKAQAIHPVPRATG